MTPNVRTRITGLLTCLLAGASLISVHFARLVLDGLLGHSGTVHLPRPAVYALALTRPELLLLFMAACLAVVALSEAVVKAESSRLLIQVLVLLILGSVLAVVLSAFFISFHIPDVAIP